MSRKNPQLDALISSSPQPLYFVMYSVDEVRFLISQLRLVAVALSKNSDSFADRDAAEQRLGAVVVAKPSGSSVAADAAVVIASVIDDLQDLQRILHVGLHRIWSAS